MAWFRTKASERSADHQGKKRSARVGPAMRSSSVARFRWNQRARERARALDHQVLTSIFRCPPDSAESRLRKGVPENSRALAGRRNDDLRSALTPVSPEQRRPGAFEPKAHAGFKNRLALGPICLTSWLRGAKQAQGPVPKERKVTITNQEIEELERDNLDFKNLSFRASDVCSVAGVSPNTLKNWIGRGQLKLEKPKKQPGWNEFTREDLFEVGAWAEVNRAGISPTNANAKPFITVIEGDLNTFAIEGVPSSYKRRGRFALAEIWRPDLVDDDPDTTTMNARPTDWKGIVEALWSPPYNLIGDPCTFVIVDTLKLWRRVEKGLHRLVAGGGFDLLGRFLGETAAKKWAAKARDTEMRTAPPKEPSAGPAGLKRLTSKEAEE